MTVERSEPPYIADERASLRAWLDFHRATLLLKCEGLDEAGLNARPIPSSTLSLHGLLRHLSEVESSEQVCRALVELALSRGGSDNITVVIPSDRTACPRPGTSAYRTAERDGTLATACRRR